MNQTTTKRFSGIFAIFATLVLGFAMSNQVMADEFSDSEQAALDQHYEILAVQQADSEQELLTEQMGDFEEQLGEAEQDFMTDTCDTYDREYDTEAEVCVE